MPGDGIGKNVLQECIRVLDAAGFAAEYIEADIGKRTWITFIKVDTWSHIKQILYGDFIKFGTL